MKAVEAAYIKNWNPSQILLTGSCPYMNIRPTKAPKVKEKMSFDTSNFSVFLVGSIYLLANHARE